MLKNTEYNLMEEITKLSQSLYRYDMYIKDAQLEGEGCAECATVWTQLKQRHEEDLATLLQQLKHHTETGMLDEYGPIVG